MDFLHFSILGKYGQSTGNNPLIYHLLDVAAVAIELWDHICSVSTKKIISCYITSIFKLNGNNETEVRRFIAFLSSLHDLGKITPNFQKKIWNSGPLVRESIIFNFYKNLFQINDQRMGSREHIHHSALSFQLVQDLKSISIAPIKFQNFNLKEIGLILSGHHGYFHKNEILLKIRRNKIGQLGNEAWREIQKSHVEAIVNTLFYNYKKNNNSDLNNSFKLHVQNTIWLSGFICISDWIASNEKYFPYNDKLPERWSDLHDYWKTTQKHAENAVQNLNWGIKNIRIGKNKRSFFHIFKKKPRDLQHKIEVIDISQPECVIIEAPTGEGKTEAAMYLMVKNDLIGLSGAYFALPTQATSNQMFLRVKDFLATYYINPDEKLSLMLLHGHATLVEDFEKIIDFSPKNISDDDEQSNAIPYVNQWFTYRKRGLLTSYGVGTIDQALMSVLQTKHYFVRLLGLTGKTIILDEVHAYDAFMSEIIEKMLTWLAVLGSSVVILSATLPSAKRLKLLNAYQKGKFYRQNNRNYLKNEFSLQYSYPRITWTYENDVKEIIVKPSSVGKKSVKITWIKREGINKREKNLYQNEIFEGKVHDKNLREYLEEKLCDGGCAAVICNRVDEAQEIYQELEGLKSNEGYKVLLLHSRYRICERKKIENMIIKYFGEDRKYRPKKAIVIATQVIEQSLDIDFDIMISAIAPMDLILQRIGRLHRHTVNNELRPIKEPELVIMIPAFGEEVSIKGLPNFKYYGRIYHPHILLRSWLYLKDISKLNLPEMTEGAIEFVYNEISNIPNQYKAESNLIDFWEETWENLQLKREKISKMAINQLIRDPDGAVPLYKISESQLHEDDPTIHEFQRAQTRLIGPSLGIVLLKKEELSYYEHFLEDFKRSSKGVFSKDFKKWLLERSINITNYLVIKTMKHASIPLEWENDSHLRFSKLIILEDSNEININNKLKLKLDSALGLIIKKIKGE